MLNVYFRYGFAECMIVFAKRHVMSEIFRKSEPSLGSILYLILTKYFVRQIAVLAFKLLLDSKNLRVGEELAIRPVRCCPSCVHPGPSS